MILIVVEPLTLLSHSETHGEEHEATAMWVSESTSPYITFEHKKLDHTHEENRNPIPYRTVDLAVGTASLY